MSLFLALALQAATAASAPASAAATPFPANEDSRIVCRNLSGTGSRLSTQKVCLPKREWQRMWDNSKEAMHGLQDKQSTRPSVPGR